LQKGLVSKIDSTSGEFEPCSTLGAQDAQTQAIVARTIDLLQNSLKYNPGADQSLRMLARAYCQSGQPELAVKALDQILQIRPKNILASIELGFALEAFCGSKVPPASSQNPENYLCADPVMNAQIVSTWLHDGLTGNDMSAQGDLAINSADYKEAFNWYERGYLLGWKPDSYQGFKWAAASILNGIAVPSVLTKTVNIYPVTSSVEIKGISLQWMHAEDRYWNIHFGQPLSDHPFSDPTIGALWWQGAGAAILRIPCQGDYQIQIYAMHIPSTGENGKLQIEDDLKPVEVITLDSNWNNYTINVSLSQGDHLLGIRYEKDVGDALINWIRVSPLQTCRQ